jgi:transposase
MARGRPEVLGRFESRRDLEMYVVKTYFTTRLTIRAIARKAKVHRNVANKIVARARSVK